MSLQSTDIIDNAIRMINGVGFPIVVSIALFWFNIQSLENQSELIRKFEVSITANTQLLQRVANEGSNRSVLSTTILNELKTIKETCK